MMAVGADAERQLKRARLLSWLTIAYLCSTLTLLFIVLSGSQALRTEFVGDALSMIPPVMFLVGERVSRRPPSVRYPFGFERAASAGHLGSALALMATGGFLFAESALKLIMREHPSIGGFPIFGQVVWTGWLAFPVLLWSSVPAFFLGRAKKKLALALNDKGLLADAKVNAADWQSAGAAMIGVLGIAFGLWWMDAAAALVISFEIMREGFSEVRSALGDILDRRPQKLESKEPEELPDRITDFLKQEPWVKDAIVRLRERGREYSAEAFVIPAEDAGLVEHLERCSRHARSMDPRLEEIVIVPVRAFSEELEIARPDRS